MPLPSTIGTGRGLIWYRKGALTPPPVNDPISVVAAGAVLTQATATTWNVGAPAGTVAGDFLLAYISVTGTPLTVTPPSGWVNAGSEIGDYVASTHSLFYKIADGSEGASFTFGLSASRSGAAVCIAVRGVDPADPIDVANLDTINSTSLPLPIVTATGPGLLIGLVGLDAARTITAPAPMTTQATKNTTPSFTIATELLAAGGATPSRTFTSSGTLTHQVFTIVLRD